MTIGAAAAVGGSSRSLGRSNTLRQSASALSQSTHTDGSEISVLGPVEQQALQALEASLVSTLACVDVARALDAAAPSAVAAKHARLTSLSRQLADAVEALGKDHDDGSDKSDDDGSDREEVAPPATLREGAGGFDRGSLDSTVVESQRVVRGMPATSWKDRFSTRQLLGLVPGHEDPDAESAFPTRGSCMLSPMSNLRICWDVNIAICLAYVAVVEPLDLGFWGPAMTAPGTVLGTINIFIDVDFIVDLFLNFRTGFLDEHHNLVLEPRASAFHYLKTWFCIDFASSMPPVIELLAFSIDKGRGDGDSDIIKVARVMKIIKLLRLFKLLKLTDSESGFADAVEDYLLTSAFMVATRAIGLIVLAFFFAHLLACAMAATGNGWYESYGPDPSKDQNPEDWFWWRRYVISFYWAITTMTTVGYGDVTPQDDRERIFCVFAMILGVAFYSYIIATVASMVTASDAKQAVYYERMEELRSWMRHYRFGLTLRRRTRRFFKEYYASSSAIDDAAILENLAPRLQEDVANYLLHDAIKHHPLFRDLPEGTLWKVLAIVRQVSFDPDAVVIASGAPSSTLFILHQGTCACAYNGKSRQGLGEGTSFGELCMLGLSTTSLVTCTCETACVFFFIPRDRFLAAFSNLPEVLSAMADKQALFRRRRVRVPKVVVVGPDESVSPRS